jgi:hypothetical protein
MHKRIFNPEEQKELLANNNVLLCSNKSVTCSTDFKIGAVRQYESGLTATEIFSCAGFDLNLIGRDSPSECLRRWRAIVNKKGFSGLSESRGRNKGSKSKPKKMSEAERMRYLEAEVKYLKAENAFLAQLRAKRAERYSGRNKNIN